MNFKLSIESFPENSLYKLLSNIINENKITSYDELKNELSLYRTDIDHKNYHLSLTDIDEESNDSGTLSMFNTVHVSHNLRNSDKLIDNVTRYVKSCVVDRSTLLPLVYTNKHTEYLQDSNYHTFDTIHTVQERDYLKDKDTISFYKNYIGQYMVLFNHNDKWLVTDGSTVTSLESDADDVVCLFCETLKNKTNVDDLDKNYSYHFIFAHHRLNRPVVYPQWGPEFSELVHLKTVEKYTLKAVTDYTFKNNFIHNNRLYFSCLDELLMHVDGINKHDTLHKQLTTKGVLMVIGSGTADTDEIMIDFNTDLYRRISTHFENCDNLHHIHLKIYQQDKCNDVLPYVTDNYTNIIRRINISIKTLSKEILNIYFLTRNKNNTDLYDVLSKHYKDCLFNIHKIFMQKRTEDLRNVDGDGLMEKRSVTVDNVYKHLKSLSTTSLINLYVDRESLLESISKLENVDQTIVNPTCINTIIQTQLLNK